MMQAMTAKVLSRPLHTGVRVCLHQFRRRTWEQRDGLAVCLTMFAPAVVSDEIAGRDSSLDREILFKMHQKGLVGWRTGVVEFCMMESERQPNPRARKAGQPTMDRQVKGEGEGRRSHKRWTHVRHWPRATCLLSSPLAFIEDCSGFFILGLCDI